MQQTMFYFMIYIYSKIKYFWFNFFLSNYSLKIYKKSYADKDGQGTNLISKDFDICIACVPNGSPHTKWLGYSALELQAPGKLHSLAVAQLGYNSAYICLVVAILVNHPFPWLACKSWHFSVRTKAWSDGERDICPYMYV